jgi:hypothetical protein
LLTMYWCLYFRLVVAWDKVLSLEKGEGFDDDIKICFHGSLSENRVIARSTEVAHSALSVYIFYIDGEAQLVWCPPSDVCV